MSEHPLFASEFDIHIFYDLSPLSLAGMNVKCMDNDARMQIEMMSWMQSNKQRNNQYRCKCKSSPRYYF